MNLLVLADQAAVQSDEAAINYAQTFLTYTAIHSPVDGRTGVRMVDAGNIVRTNDVSGLVVIMQLEPISVVFTLPQDQLTPVATAQASGQLPVDAYARDGTTLLGQGRLEVIDNQINQATSTVRLKAVLPNPNRLLWPNQFVNARLRLGTHRGALVVPAQAVQRGPSGTFVYVVGQDGTASARPVVVETTAGDLAVLASGVAEGEDVILYPTDVIADGVAVTAR